MQERRSYTRLTSWRLCWWQDRHGMQWLLKQLRIVGSTQVSLLKLRYWPHFDHAFFRAQPKPTMTSDPQPCSSPTSDPKVWAIIKDYASGVINSFPEVEENLKEYLGISYNYIDWWDTPLWQLSTPRMDMAKAIKVIEKLLAKKSTLPLPLVPPYQILIPHVHCCPNLRSLSKISPSKFHSSRAGGGFKAEPSH